MHLPEFTVREATIELLRSLGLTTVFGNPGSTELPFFKSWPTDFRYILGLQESSVVAMADGYAQATRSAAFVNLHSATGLGHALGNIFTAYCNQTPLVITAGQQTRALLPAQPYLYARSSVEFPKPYVKWSCEPARAQDVPTAIAQAYYRAMQPPCGPTFVSIPMDDWDAEADLVAPRRLSFEFAPDPAAVRQIAEALNASQRPALIVGPAVDRDGGWDLAVELAERTRAAVWASPLSSRSSFPEDHPLFAGFLPPGRQPLSEQLAAYDVVIVLGAPIFTYHVHTGGTVAPAGTQLFHLTDDPEAAAMALAGTSVLTTLRLGLTELLARVEPSTRPAPVARVEPAAPPPAEPMSGEFVMHTVARVMPRAAIIVEEAPTHRNAMHDYLPIRRSGGFFVGASGGLGYGLPAAVGVALADPTRPVICLVGDGSSQYSIQGLWTAARHHLPVVFVVLNNGQYAALKAFSEILRTGKTLSFDLPGIDLVSIARGYGCAAARVERAADLAETLRRAIVEGGPWLLDVHVDPTVPVLY
jgi:benzoylformate decarboxylase